MCWLIFSILEGGVMKKNMLCVIFMFLCIGVYSQAQDLNVGKDVPTKWEGWGSRIFIRGVGDHSDNIYIGKYCLSENHTQMRLNICDDKWGDDCVVIGTDAGSDLWKGIFYFYNNGKVGIKTDNPQTELDVNGTIRANEIKVESEWADFVFKKGYNLPTITEVKQHIEEKGTLPGIPSEKEVKANGVNLAETDVLLLQKIEELTLYIIELKQEIEDLKSQVNN
ncbi:hypothetical protein INE81_00449 [Bacteroides salyersiae]|nr:hypothetical protein INE81_00449 [Bacteroides salyersiae]